MNNNQEKLKVIVNNQLEFNELDDQSLDMVQTDNNSFQILNGSTAYNAEIIYQNFDEKEFKVKVNGTPYDVKIEDEYDILIHEMGLKVGKVQKVNKIDAPMPGLVLEISVADGQEVNAGDSLLILEAMKMENIIKSPGQGVIDEILVKTGQAVDKGQLLIKFK